jgi:hypothetical protein
MNALCEGIPISMIDYTLGERTRRRSRRATSLAGGGSERNTSYS